MTFRLPATPADVAAYCGASTTPAEDPIQRHDIADEADQPFQHALHELAARCGGCGRPMAEAGGQ